MRRVGLFDRSIPPEEQWWLGLDDERLKASRRGDLAGNNQHDIDVAIATVHERTYIQVFYLTFDKASSGMLTSASLSNKLII